MTQDNLFQNDPQSEPQIDLQKNYLDDLVGDGKKFKDLEALAKGKAFADQTVELQNRRLDEMRAEYEKVRKELDTRASVKELFDQMRQHPSKDGQQPSNSETPQAKDNAEPFDPSKLEDLVDKKVRQIESFKKQNDNANLVRAKLKEQFGTSFQTILKERTEALGLTEEFVNDLAKNHPSVLFRTLGIEGQPTQDNLFQAPPRSQQRSDSFAPTSSQKRTWSYYKNLFKAKPELKFDRQTAIQMQEDAINMGEAFRDGDYFVKGLHEQ